MNLSIVSIIEDIIFKKFKGVMYIEFKDNKHFDDLEVILHYENYICKRIIIPNVNLNYFLNKKINEFENYISDLIKKATYY